MLKNPISQPLWPAADAVFATQGSYLRYNVNPHNCELGIAFSNLDNLNRSHNCDKGFAIVKLVTIVNAANYSQLRTSPQSCWHHNAKGKSHLRHLTTPCTLHSCKAGAFKCDNRVPSTPTIPFSVQNILKHVHKSSKLPRLQTRSPHKYKNIVQICLRLHD